MSARSTPWSLPDKTVERAEEADREIRMSDFALMALLVPRGSTLAPATPQRARDGWPWWACASSGLRAAERSCPRSSSILVATLLALLIFSGLANDVDWVRRVGHLGIMAGLIWAVRHRPALPPLRRRWGWQPG